MNFIIIDLTFLVLFCAFLFIFLYSKRKNLKREGLLFLYRTSWGIKLINYVGGKYKKTLRFLSYVSIALGYLLMAGMLYLFGKIVYLYVRFPEIVRAIKVPPAMPLIPYLPQMFKLDFLPSFYFTYWIIIIAIIAITHEFAHGIFAKHAGVEIKSTGFGFLGPFLAAFVEPDEKELEKKSKFSQLAMLSAGTFANILTAIFFFVVLIIFFSLAFSPSGVVFDTYVYSAVGIANISSVNNISIDNPSYEKILNLLNETGLNKIETDDKSYLTTKELLEQQENFESSIILYDDAPAINSGLVGAIIEIDGMKIKSGDDLKEELEKHSPKDKIEITTETDENILKYEIVLEEHPENDGLPWLGIGFFEQTRSGVIGKAYSLLSSFKDEHVYYKSKFTWMIFVYDLLWWIILISISVALINMLPVGIFDGGRVFYLTALLFLKDESKAKRIFSWITYIIILLFLSLMFFWLISFI